MTKEKFVTLFLAVVCGIMLMGCSSDSTDGIPTRSQIKEAKSQLPDNLDSFEFSLDGVIYEFPIEVSQLLDNGWTLRYVEGVDDFDTIPAHTTVSNIHLWKQSDGTGEYPNAFCKVTLVNETDEEQPWETSKLEALIIWSGDAILILPQGISWNNTFKQMYKTYHLTLDQTYRHKISKGDWYRSINIKDTEKDRALFFMFNRKTGRLETASFFNGLERVYGNE